jgi:NitT/TauT family transport system substrate-binding protein
MSDKMNRAHLLSLAAVAPLAVGAQDAPIRIGAAATDAHAQPFYANELGYFQRAGLNVAITISGRAGAAAEMVAANALDVCLADAIQVAHPVNAGVPLAFFAGAGLYTSDHPTTLLVVAADSPVRQARDFEGKTIAVIGLASIGSSAVSEWLRKNGAELARVKLVELQFANMVAALGRGVIAGALLAEPFLSASNGSIRVLAKAYDAIAKSFAISTFFASRSWLTTNRDAARKFVAVMYDTARWANANQADSAEILAKISMIDLGRVRAMTRISYATSLDARQLQPPLDAALKYGDLETHIDANALIFKA